MKQTCILILGMHRSGTSALTGVLNVLGVYLGSELMAGNSFNKKGYFENNKFFAINEALLKQIGSSWDDIFFNPDKMLSSNVETELKNKIKEEFEYSNLFAIKDPRITFLIPSYKRALEELNIEIKVIIPYRNPIEVANSLAKRNNFAIEKGMLLWAQNFLLTEKYSRSFDRIFIDFNNLIQNPENTLSLISDELNIKFEYAKNKKKINNFLNPNLKHHNLPIDNLSEKTPLIIKKILELIRTPFDSENIFKFDVLRKEFYSYQNLFFNQDVKDNFFNYKKTKIELKKNQICLKNKTETIDNQQNELKQYAKTIDDKQDELEQCTRTIDNQKNELEQCTRTIDNQKNELHQYAKTIDANQDELVNYAKSVDVKQAELDQYTKIINNQQKELVQYVKTVDNQQNELEQNTKILKKQKNESESVQQKFTLNKKQLIQKNKELEIIKIEIEHLKNELVELYTERGYGLTRRIKKIVGYLT